MGLGEYPPQMSEKVIPQTNSFFTTVPPSN